VLPRRPRGREIGTMRNTLAMEAVAELCGRDGGARRYDIARGRDRQLYNSEAGWRIIDDTVQIRGGRGYETADSLRAPASAIAVERIMRDFRINLIFEGSSEIMHCSSRARPWTSISQVAGDVVLPENTAGALCRPGPSAGRSWGWYPSRCWAGACGRVRRVRAAGEHVRFVERSCRRLARSVFHAMIRFGRSSSCASRCCSGW